MKQMRLWSQGLLTVLLFAALVTPARAAPQTSAAAPTPVPTPVPAAAPDLPSTADLTDRQDALDRLLNDLRDGNDLTRVDLDELGFALGSDADEIVGWVGQHIDFQQYPGLLRGARGTLVTRAGNALDQAVLLARLLGDAGYEIRVVRGELAADQAAALVQQIAARREPLPAPDPATLTGTLSEIGALYGIAADMMQADVAAAAVSEPLTATATYQAAQEQATAILARLRAAGVELGAAAALDDLVQEARDYFWVEYRLSPADPWTSAHPAFGAVTAPAGISATAVYSQTIPDDLIQRLRVRVLVEQKQDGQLVEQEIMPAWDSPVADLIGKPVTLQLYPDGIADAADLVDLDRLIEATTFYLPVFDGAVVQDGAAFDLNGNVIPVGLLEQSAGMGEVGSSMGSTLEGAVGAFGGPEDTATPAPSASPTPNPDDLISLTGAWIEYTLTVPGAEETVVRRPILDRIGAENRQAGKVAIAAGMEFPQAARALLTAHTIVVLPGDYTPAYVADRTLGRMIAELPLAQHLSGDSESTISPELDQSLRDLPRMEDVLLASAFVPGTQVDPGIITWRPAPTLVVVDRGYLPDRGDVGFVRTDIVTNPRRALRVAGDTLNWAPDAALQVGIWETFMEGAPLLDGGGAQFNTQLAFDWARQQAIPLQVITPDDPGALKKLRLDAQTLLSLGRDLAAGYVVVAPTRLPSGQNQVAWWRIDPASGTTLGVGSDGRGQAADEYAITLKSVLLSAALSTPGTIYSFQSCVSGGGSVGCCAAVNGATFAGGLLLGMGVTKVLGGVVSLISTDILLNGVQVGATYGGLPFPLPNMCS